MSNIIKSPLNYHGGKTKILPLIYPLLPSNINNFVDLFAGGFNVGINVKANKYYCNDIQKEVIDLYRTFKNLNRKDIIEYINNRIEAFGLSKMNKQGYLRFRKVYNSNPLPLDLFILIAFSHSHIIRFNNKGEFNTAFGKNRRGWNDVMKQNLELFVNKLHEIDVEFSNVNFIDFDYSIFNEKDFVYFDPPYLISFANYNKLWNETTEKHLLTVIDNLNNRNIKFALSNVIEHKGKENHILLNWLNNRNYYINHINSDYSNCSYNKNKDTKNMKTKEVLITNYNPSFSFN